MSWILIHFKDSSLSVCLDCICSHCRPIIGSPCSSISLNKTVASTVFKKEKMAADPRRTPNPPLEQASDAAPMSMSGSNLAQRHWGQGARCGKFDVIFMDKYMTSIEHGLKGMETVWALWAKGVTFTERRQLQLWQVMLNLLQNAVTFTPSRCKITFLPAGKRIRGVELLKYIACWDLRLW